MPDKPSEQYEKAAEHNVLQFLTHISEKNYAEANKYLRNALELKFKGKVKDTAGKIGF
tara:strand:- start:2930 stop:3103 length:174 start_codon:yes stop_codon:yes gene_type:complete